MFNILQKSLTGNIRKKLLINVFITCFFPMLLMGTVTFWHSRNLLLKELDSSSNEYADQFNSSINLCLQSLTSTINILQDNSLLKNYVHGQNTDQIVSLFDNTKNNCGNASSVFLLTKDNLLISNSGEQMCKSPYTDSEIYKEITKNNGNLVMTEPHLVNNKKIITIAKYLLDYNGDFIGVIGIDIDIDELSNKLLNIKSNDQDIAILTKSDNVFISTLGDNISLQILNTLKSSKQSNELIRTKIDDNIKYIRFIKNEANQLDTYIIYNYSKLSESLDSMFYNVLIIFIIANIFAFMISLRMSKSISINTKQLKDAFVKASDGDFTINTDIQSNDEFQILSDSFNTMLKNISELINSIKISTDVLSETSNDLAIISVTTNESMNEVALAMDQIGKGTENLSNEAQYSSNEIISLSESLDKINIQTKDVTNISRDTERLTSEGLTVINDLSEVSEITRKSFNEVTVNIKEMTDCIKNINQISDTISDISEQTNLLSLNASIEAARAGEAGKGFAVVANEVKNLAEQSNKATNEIKSIINNIIMKSNQTFEAVKNSESQNTKQSLAVKKTEDIFTEISSAISHLNKNVDEIDLSINNIDKKKENVAKQIESTTAISEETASMTEEVVASIQGVTDAMKHFKTNTKSLEMITKELNTQIDKFKI